MVDMTDHTCECQKLREENEELRDLVKRIYKTAQMLCDAWEGPCSSDYSWQHQCPIREVDAECVYGAMELEMRQLGIEVDG